MPSSSEPHWRAIITELRVPRRRSAALVAVLVLATALPLAGPQLLRAFVDDAIGGRPLHILITLAVAYLAVVISARVLVIGVSWLASAMAWEATNDLRTRLAAHALSLDHAFHTEHTPGEMIERVDGDVAGLTEFLSGFVVQAIGSLLLLVGTLVLVWREDVRIGALLTVFVAVACVAVVGAQRRVVPYAAQQRATSATLYGNLEERLSSADDIRANGAGAHVLRRFFEDSAAHYRAELQWQLTGGTVVASTSMLFSVGTALMIGAGVVLAHRGAITVGTVILLYQYAQMVRRPVEQIIGQVKQLQQAGASAVRVADLLAQQSTIVDALNPHPLREHGALPVSFEAVTFIYPDGPDDPPVLHDVSLCVEAGRSLGLVGETGSGKTTITRLLVRFFETQHGRVAIDDVDVRLVPLAQLRRRVRLVTQDVQLFDASVRDNVTLFDDDVDDKAVLAALDAVGLAPWLSSLPDGLRTNVGTSGIGVSAGEAQLLALARAFVADPGVVILDEPASRLDPITEVRIATALDRLLVDRTAIVIAHRPATLARVDDIAVLEGGRVMQHGPRESVRVASSALEWS